MLQYDPKQVTLVIGGHIMFGFADDDFIEVERDEDAFTKKTGVDGTTTRAKNNVRTGKITFRLMQSSASNDDLQALAYNDEIGNSGAVPVTCKDGNGRSVFSAQNGWVKKLPKAGYKKDVDMREWVIDTDAMDITIGGN
jgi:hypothetical protein